MIRVLKSADAPAAIGPYSPGIEAGGIVYVSGQIPLVPQTGELLTGPVGEQTAQALRNVEAVLREAGCTLRDVVKTTVLLQDMNDFAEMNAVYAGFFPENAPARACFQAARLPRGAAVEIECIAHRP